MDVRSALTCATHDLEGHGVATPRLDAEVLLSCCINTDRLSLYAHPEKTLTEKDLRIFQGWIARRREGEPVAYITGRKEFWSLPFEVNDQVLIPRPETELLVEAILRTYSNRDGAPLVILDIGTGSGAISIALATELERSHIVATDISRGALSVAARNARKNGVHRQISFRWGSLFEPVSEKFDIIVSNPPYISEEAFEHLPRGVQAFEPRLALLAEAEGTSFHREIITRGIAYLKEGGRLFMETGSDQKAGIVKILEASNGYDDISFIRDYAGFERAFTARKKGEVNVG